MSATVWPTIVTILSTISVVPLTYIFNTYTSEFNRNVRLGIGASLPLIILLLVYLLTRRRVRSNLYYALTGLCITSGVFLILALELDGYIEKALSAFLAQAEPHVDSVSSLLICYFYGTFGLLSYIYMIYCLTNGLTIKNVGLHSSAGSLIYAVVKLTALSLGESRLGNQIFVRTPVVVCFMYLLIHSFGEERKKQNFTRKSSFIDKLLALLLIGGAVVSLVKGLVSLGHKSSFIYWYENDVEPIMKQTTPAPVSYVLGLVSLFYYLPAYLVLAGALFKNPEQEWVHSLSLVLAGAVLQAGVYTVGSSIHPLTEVEYRAPSHSRSMEFIVFWCANILMTLTPQLVAFRLSCSGEEGRRKLNEQKKTN